MKKVVIFLFITSWFIYWLVDAETPDATSGATPYSKNIRVPESSDNYDVFLTSGIQNYLVRYSDDFLRGGTIHTVEGVTALKEMGVKSIISITPDDKERALAKKFNLKLIELPFSMEDIPETVFLQLATEMASGVKCYVHCHGGTHRAGILGMFYRIRREGWSFAKAKEEFVALGGFPTKDKLLLDALQNYLEKSDEN